MNPLVIVCLAIVCSAADSAEKITPHLSLQSGPVNGAVIQKDGARLVVYGLSRAIDGRVDQVLLTHHRRDVAWAARGLVDQGASTVAPAAERDAIEKPQEFWAEFSTRRFHDYAQQSTKILAEPLRVDRWVKGGDRVEWNGLEFQVLDTPGFTRGAISYLVDLDEKRIAFTGDLIYGDGQLLDLYSFQDEIPSAKIGGYHGYASRLAMLVPSLKKIADTEPDLLVPARGPVIRNPQAAIKKLIGRVQAVYRNYLSTNALNWYFKEERMTISGRRVLGEDADIQLMPYSLHQKTPDWVWEQATSRMLISDNGRGFLLDCGYQRVIDAAQKLVDSGLVTKIDGIFVTHYHDDHTNMVAQAARDFDCPVYATEEYEDILERPGAYHLPALTSNGIPDVKGMKNGQSMKWEEFDLTFHFYPGQTLFHGALQVKKKGQRQIMFIGDAFSPSGIDDYCLLNRNLIHDDSGYLLCLRKLRQLKEDYWLVNEHIPWVFKFSDKEMDYLESRYRERKAVLTELFPWDDPNYGIDEQWAVFYPYGQATGAGKVVDLEVRFVNHSPRRRTFSVVPHLPAGGQLVEGDESVTLDARAEGGVRLKVRVPEKPGDYVVTVDVRSEGMDFRRWSEALITVE